MIKSYLVIGLDPGMYIHWDILKTSLSPTLFMLTALHCKYLCEAVHFHSAQYHKESSQQQHLLGILASFYRRDKLLHSQVASASGKAGLEARISWYLFLNSKDCFC